MSSTSSVTQISGAVSGLDTASLVNSLVQAEGATQTLMKTRQTKAQTAADTYTKLITELGAVGDKAAALAKTSSWLGSTGSSSSTNVTTSVTGSANGSITFDVQKVAKAHTLVSASAVASTATTVAGSSIDLLSADGNTVKGTIDTGSGSLEDVVAGINASGLGLRAAAVQASAGSYRLQVTSTTSGEGSQFQLSGLTGFTGGTNGTQVLTAGQDAKLSIGDQNAYTVTSSTNTFKDLVPGMSFTVSKEETGVTVGATLDGSQVATQVSSLVDSANQALKDLAASTAYDTTSNSGAALYGSSTVRLLQQQILDAVSGSGAPGVSLTKDGALSFDADAFKTAFVADPAKTATAYGARITSDSDSVSLRAGSTATRAGTYAVSASVAAAREAWSSGGAAMDSRTVVITKGSLTASYTVGSPADLADAVQQINERAAQAGIGVSAAVDNGSIIFTSTSYGTSGAFDVSIDGSAADQVEAGRDVEGSIDGRAATGVGNVLYLTDADSGANGIRLQVDGDGDLGTFTYQPGLAQRLSTLLDRAANSTSGTLTTAKNGQLDQVKDLQSQIDSWDLRLAAYRQTVTAQFTAMETAMSSLKSQTSALSGLLTSSSS